MYSLILTNPEESTMPSASFFLRAYYFASSTKFMQLDIADNVLDIEYRAVNKYRKTVRPQVRW